MVSVMFKFLACRTVLLPTHLGAASVFLRISGDHTDYSVPDPEVPQVDTTQGIQEILV